MKRAFGLQEKEAMKQLNKTIIFAAALAATLATPVRAEDVKAAIS